MDISDAALASSAAFTPAGVVALMTSSPVTVSSEVANSTTPLTMVDASETAVACQTRPASLSQPRTCPCTAPSGTSSIAIVVPAGRSSGITADKTRGNSSVYADVTTIECGAIVIP